MGSMASAIHDDENEWADLKRSTELRDVDWGPYSKEASYVKLGYHEFKFVGPRLKLFVKHQVEKHNLGIQQILEIEEFANYEKLLKKYA